MGRLNIRRDLRRRLLLLFLLISTVPAFSQQVAVKTNMLYWMTTTPNVGAEWRLYPHYSLSATVGHNAFNFGQYNVGGIEFIHALKDRRYDGWLAGGGISYGYQWTLGKRWALDTGHLRRVRYAYLEYDKYNCGACGRKYSSYHKHLFLCPPKLPSRLSTIYAKVCGV